ncbi:MAG TPA: hypothetical protein VH541_09660 [Gaiellaceae bacterium]
METHAPGFPFSLEPLMAEAKRRMRKRRVLIAVLTVLVVGGAAGAAEVVTSSSGIRPAGACPVTGGYYAYAVPEDPAHPAAAGDGPTSWAWTPRKHQVKVGDRLRENGRLWEVTEIAAMPGVEPVGRPFGIIGWPGIRFHRVAGKLVPYQPVSGNTSLTMCGRLVFRPVS